ncbi:Asp-tRNA(Asn)/Glu-tRNA(Gln) amidotransferase subunit GatB [Mycoplasma miroungirhinis]|uniref:Aspartyl/glutamyl-tRNA(Asn/Gln) amidotransferase subunit B n=1 Tax=Mycoplasma miroungirhinis TaxID=754516 RepID=A0A6M4JCG4_9MOLU|nr:Asp-tRNA(Asn)/Glu-tRNA(Gln) amidotransferase subunit GatB [Mycoplasma miroungirhinis]QJR44035.1 Asp-tRNA(Asn)/Glu-tRNA(Gln) amidotransferase subunit GatB [Mycoplasma miroungirhinis]
MNYLDYEPVIGIEIHLELSTKTKMFSYAENNFNLAANTSASVIDLAYPGTLPLLNKQAVIFGIKLAKALNMQIDNELHFDRKNYFYPDLPKGYQITQQFRPIAKNGIVPIEINDTLKNITIERIHLEEDTAKQIHEDQKTFLNYNRAGVPLIEIVSNPVIRSAKEAAEYVNTIRLIALSLGISDAKMNEGSLRADINISVRKKGQETFNTRVEIKNLNSISNVEKAIDYEFKWQVEKIQNNEQFPQQTKRFDETSQTTKTMRLKSSAIDYKYFPEPNIPIIKLTNELINRIIIEELPWQKKSRYIENGLNKVQYDQLLKNLDYANFVDNLATKSQINLKKVTNLFFSDIVSFLNEQNLNINDLKISLDYLIAAIQLIDQVKIQKNALNVILLQTQLNPALTLDSIIENNNLKLKDLSDEIEMYLDQLILSKPEIIDDYKQNSDKVLKFLVGQIMKNFKGQANPVTTKQIIEKKFKK